MHWRSTTIPIFLAGLWPSSPSISDSGARVVILDKMGGEVLIEGSSDEFGHFRSQLSKRWVGKPVHLVVVEPSFKYDHSSPVVVQKWGLMLAVRQEKDLWYSGHNGARATAPEKWERWNSTERYLEASRVINAATRQARIAWPLREFGFAIALGTGIAGYFISPLGGVVLGLLTFFLMELVAHTLFRRGY